MAKILPFVKTIAMFAALVFAGGCATSPPDDNYLVYVDEESVILEGYDVVAFFTQGRAVQGSSRYKSRYHGAEYHFANATNKNTFDAEPERYKPQFGAYCSMAMSMGRLEPADVRTWSIVDGRLVVNRNEKAKAMWSMNPRGNLRKADANWPIVLRDNGKRG